MAFDGLAFECDFDVWNGFTGDGIGEEYLDIGAFKFEDENGA